MAAFFTDWMLGPKKSSYSYETLKKKNPPSKPGTPPPSFHPVIGKFFSISRDSFIFLKHKDLLADEKMEQKMSSGHKIHFNFADNNQLAKAWNAMAPLLITGNSIVKQVKVVVPDLVEKIYQDNVRNAALSPETAASSIALAELDRNRRLTGTQVTLFIYNKSKPTPELKSESKLEAESKPEVDVAAYVHLIKALEAVLAAANIRPQSSTVPTGDTRLSTYTSMRLDTDAHGRYIAPEDMEKFPPSALVAEFIRQFELIRDENKSTGMGRGYIS